MVVEVISFVSLMVLLGEAPFYFLGKPPDISLSLHLFKFLLMKVEAPVTKELESS